MIIRRLTFLLIILLFVFPLGSYGADGKIGIVLLHGKQDRAPYKIASLANRLKDEGYLVVTPEMPWSRSRMYDATFEEAMLEIDKAFDQLKKEGAQRIIISGLSMGGNAALGYGARRNNLSGIIIMAPGHFPETPKFLGMSASDIAKAKELSVAGKADEKIDFNDSNMGRTFTSHARVKVYLSYFDPEGPAVIPANAAAIRSSIPILWIVGKKDPATRPSSYAFDKAPTNPKSKYLAVDAGHLDTPDVTADQIILWIADLWKK
jgi:esterase/lipase